MRKLPMFAATLMFALSQGGDAAAPRKSSKANWGAIAYNTKTGSFGYVVDAPSKRNAESEAFKQCGSDCDLIKTFRNACGAIAARPKHAAWDTGASRAIAEAKALSKCRSESCKIAVWACTGEK